MFNNNIDFYVTRQSSPQTEAINISLVKSELLLIAVVNYSSLIYIRDSDGRTDRVGALIVTK